MKYKVGDKVKLRSGIRAGRNYGVMYLIEEMLAYEELTIRCIVDSTYRVDENEYSYTGEMLCGSEEDETIVSGSRTYTKDMLHRIYGLAEDDDGETSTHTKITKELNDLYVRKNKDYGDSFTKSFEDFGLVSAVIRLTDKVNRLRTLAANESLVKDESIRDTLIDLANYSIMTIIELDKEEE